MSDSPKPTLLIVDGHSLAFRAFYALPADRFITRDGQHTNAIYGFISMLILLLKNEKPTHVAAAFDVSRHSFRTREYAEYKATRNETPAEFAGQISLLHDALDAMNIVSLVKEDYEADDILATLARRGTEQGFHVLVVSGDRDTIQLVNENVTLLYPSRQGVTELTRYDPEKVHARYGIRPEQYPEIAALVGEPSDNLPGIPKVGEKTAVKWINLYGSLDAILEHAHEITGKVGESLREHRENAVRNRRLNRLVTDLDLPMQPSDLKRHPLNESALRTVFGRLEFRTLLDRVLSLEGISGGKEAAALFEEEKQAPAPPPSQILRGEELNQWLTKASSLHPQGLALVIDMSHGKPVSFGIASSDETITVPWIADSADIAPFERWLGGEFPKIMYNAKPQMKALNTVGLSFGGPVHDTLISDWLLQPGKPSKTLSALVLRHLRETLPEPDPNQLVPETEPLTPAGEAWYMFRVAEVIETGIDPGTRTVLTTIEMPLLHVLARIEQNGVAVSHDQLSTLSSQLGERATGLATKAYAEIGREVNLGSPKQLQEVLFTQLNMPKTRANKTGHSTDAAALTDLQETNPHPFLDYLLAHRDATKLNQIVETLDKAIHKDGRIHTSYVQTGTSTGRLSSTDPNLQNIPIRTEEGRRIRAAFHVSDGFQELLTADYSQIEMRIMAHLSGDDSLIAAFNEGEDLHRFVGSRIFHVAPANVTALMRTKVKAMSYGLAYGLSAFGLSKQLRIPTSEAKQLMTDYFARFGKVRDYLRNTVEQARLDGYTETLFGRRRPFPELRSTNRLVRENAERAALNAPIQGSAADIIKIAMIRIAADFREHSLQSRMLMQVHDELIFDIAPGEKDTVENIAIQNMSAAAQLSVPLEVHIGTGANWEDAAH